MSKKNQTENTEVKKEYMTIEELLLNSDESKRVISDAERIAQILSGINALTLVNISGNRAALDKLLEKIKNKVPKKEESTYLQTVSEIVPNYNCVFCAERGFEREDIINDWDKYDDCGLVLTFLKRIFM